MTSSYTAAVKELNSNGHAVLRQAIHTDLLREIAQEFEMEINSRLHLFPVSNDSARTPGTFQGPSAFLSPEELIAGQETYRHRTNHISIADPLLHCPSTLNVAFHETLLSIAGGYLGCLPAIGGLNLRKSFANNLSDFDTNYFHCDENSPRFLKFFFYLNDVAKDGGPFCYVQGSHRKKFRGWKRKYRWTYSEIASIYGEENILNLTAQQGDLIVADTAGFHRGTKVHRSDRLMLTINAVVAQEYRGKRPAPKISKAQIQRLSDPQRAAADLLEVV